MKIIDIVCGRKKIEGSIGIDNSPFSMADIVLDLNTKSLPFENSSIDFVHSSHCLEHLTLDGFLHMLNEIFRVVKVMELFT
jgi:predicted SAM-dependent methyltransferase